MSTPTRSGSEPVSHGVLLSVEVPSLPGRHAQRRPMSHDVLLPGISGGPARAVGVPRPHAAAKGDPLRHGVLLHCLGGSPAELSGFLVHTRRTVTR